MKMMHAVLTACPAGIVLEPMTLFIGGIVLLMCGGSLGAIGAALMCARGKW